MEAIALQTVAGALTLGAASSVLARRFRMPAVLFYLVSGLAAGPVGLGLLRVDALGSGLLTLVEIAVAIILFEGGLSLSAHHFQNESAAIRRLLVITLPLTGIGAALLGHFVLDLSWPFAAFFGAIIVVTGPTVIGSLLKNIHLTRRLEILLSWESIWGDVLGVLLSAVALEMILVHESEGVGQLILNFGLRLADGLLLGGLCGYLLARIILPWVARLRDPALPGLVAVASALATFALANVFLASSGPLATAVAGFTLSALKPDTLHELRHFKEQLSTLFIATLFVLLSAYINPLDAYEQWPGMLLVAFTLGALVRPLAIFIALWTTPVTCQERLFIGLIGPRGIIALATVAYASLLIHGHEQETALLLNLTFAIIFFSGLTATLLCRPLAGLLKVMVPVTGSGIIISGVNALSSGLARFAQQYVPVVVLDRNTAACSIASALATA
ncbi:MAG: cation:proton antiporter, partial [Desulfobulbaceae bacterium]|nr:cation:proton antiporter [Desulfobulbaceae bacterium]